MFRFLKKNVKLPTTLEEFDSLVQLIVKKYHFTDPTHTAGLISVAIRHLPPTQGKASLDYFADYVRKNIANHVAAIRGQELQHNSQIDQLVELLKADPNDCQARDELVKASNEGSAYAKEWVEKFKFSDSPLEKTNPEEVLQSN